jgi:hypothetical protein
VPKRHCTSRAEWRLEPGKSAQPLSAHYRLDCDYGTAVIACWEDGGSEPIYVCENHAKQVGRARERSADIRVVTAESDDSDSPIKSEDLAQVQEIVAAKPKRFVASYSARNVAATTVERTVADVPAKSPIHSGPGDNPIPLSSEDRTQVQEVVVVFAKPKGAAVAEVAPTIVDKKIERATTDAPVRSPVRDLTYGSPAKAMVDEVIWNLATGNYQLYKAALQQGKSAAEAAQAAGGQLAAVHRKIGDYTPKLEAILSESKATVSVAEAIDKPLEHAMLEIISSGEMSESEKDAAIQQLGALQEWVKHGVRGDITPVQANQIVLAIGDRLKWGGTAGVSEELKPLYRALYGSLKSAVLAAVPEAQNLHDRLTNLYAAKSDLEIC